MKVIVVLSLLFCVLAVTQPVVAKDMSGDWLKEGKVSTDHGEIYYRVTGQGEPLLLLHGYFGNGAQWQKYLDEFSPRYTVIAPDLLDHGGSASSLDRFDVAEGASAIWALLDHLGYQNIKGVGYSAGGMTLLQMALLQPQRMDAMILSASAHTIPGREEVVYEDLPESFQRDLQRNHFRGMPQILKLMQMPYVSNMQTSELRELSVPTLLVSGDRDESFPLTTVIETYQALPNAQLWVVPNLGHSLYWAEWGGDAALERVFPSRAMRFFDEFAIRPQAKK
jgi:pimeloyl-ACP methyl ester carboxylesterase